MIIRQKLGKLSSYDAENRHIDFVVLEWFETSKRILHKRSATGKEVVIKFLKEDPAFAPGDVIFEEGDTLMVIDIEPCDAILLSPTSMYQMATTCYEIGNRHLPLFYDEGLLLIPYEEPLFRLLTATGFEPVKEKRKLTNPIKTTTTPHSHNSGAGASLLSRILQLTNNGPDA